MRVDASRFIPVLIAFPDSESRQESWGRWLELRADGGRLITRTRIERGDTLYLSFELPGEPLERLRAEVVSGRIDADGYWVCGLNFPADADRELLGRAVRSILAAE